MTKARERVVIASLGLLAASTFAVMCENAADAQILPSSTTTTSAPESTTTTTATTLVPRPTTTTTEPTTSTTATTAPQVATTARPRQATTTTAPGSTTTTFVPPAGVPSATTTIPQSDGPLEADLGLLPWFVTMSLGGFAIAIAIVAVQWVRSRPVHR